MNPVIIAPSILSADFGNLQRDIEWINASQSDWFHVDVMDGVFVPNISFGFPIMQHLKKWATKPLDVHLMIVQPERYLLEFSKAGADILTVHIEACTHIHRTIQSIQSLGMKAGVAINPGTSLHAIESVLNDADLFLVMSVNPGFGGQKFIEATYDKVRHLRALLDTAGSNAIIEVDGGVGPANSSALIDAGANALVAGNAVFAAENPAEVIRTLKQLPK